MSIFDKYLNILLESEEPTFKLTDRIARSHTGFADWFYDNVEAARNYVSEKLPEIPLQMVRLVASVDQAAGSLGNQEYSRISYVFVLLDYFDMFDNVSALRSSFIYVQKQKDNIKVALRSLCNLYEKLVLEIKRYEEKYPYLRGYYESLYTKIDEYELLINSKLDKELKKMQRVMPRKLDI